MKSNHPPNIRRELPNMIQDVLSALSKNKTMFNNYKEPYGKALKSTGFNNVLKYSKQNDDTAGRKSK